MRLRVFVFACWSLLLGGAFGLGQDQQTTATERVEQLVRAHECSLGLIHQFDIQLDGWQQPNFGKWKGAPAVQSCTIHWSRQDDLERIRQVDFVRNDGFGEVEKVRFGDLFVDGKERRLLSGWNPDRPVALTPLNQNGVSCYVERHVVGQRFPVVDPAPAFLLSYLDLSAPEESHLTLRDLVKRATSVEVREGATGQPGNDGSLVCLRLQRHNQDGDGEKAGHYLDVFLDSRAGLMARKYVVHRDNFHWVGEANPLPWAEWVTEVKEFHDAGGGVFFPIESERRAYRCDQKEPTQITRLKAKTFTVNLPLPPEAFDFRFPENAQVIYDEGEKRIVHIWGPDNKPVRTLTKPREILEVQREFETQGSLQPSHVGYWIWTAVGVGVLLAAVCLALRLRRRRAAS